MPVQESIEHLAVGRKAAVARHDPGGSGRERVHLVSLVELEDATIALVPLQIYTVGFIDS